jgi:hypothetical protein
MSGFKVTYDGLSVTFLSFSGVQWPRTYNSETYPTTSFTAFGTPQERGVSFFPYFFLEGEGKLSAVADSGLSDAEKFDAIQDIWLANGGNLTIDDYTRRHNEKTTRTQALADGASVITTGTTLSYQPKYLARFVAPPTRVKVNNTEVLYAFTLVQTGVIAP